jgi:hypothetical protein
MVSSCTFEAAKQRNIEYRPQQEKIQNSSSPEFGIKQQGKATKATTNKHDKEPGMLSISFL